MIAEFQIDTSLARMDCAHVLSNMKNLSRGGVFVTTIKGFLERLKKNNGEAFALIPAEMTAKYLKPGSGYDIFGAIKPNQRRARLLETAKDLYAL
ncbi:MAG: hypothetical protein LBO66_01685, partial [Deltaproteobacteria bacterium]|nr:hypothetical protein [Deltaproteobacteria bacterium]